GTLYGSQGKLPDGRRMFSEIVRRQPRSIPALTALGVLYAAERNNTEAEKAYEAVLNVDPSAAVAANNLAWLFVEDDRDTNRALELAKSAVAQAPDNPSFNDTLGWIYYKRALFQLAVSVLEHSVEIDPTSANALMHLGLAYYKSGDFAKAREK